MFRTGVQHPPPPTHTHTHPPCSQHRFVCKHNRITPAEHLGSCAAVGFDGADRGPGRSSSKDERRAGYTPDDPAAALHNCYISDLPPQELFDQVGTEALLVCWLVGLSRVVYVCEELPACECLWVTFKSFFQIVLSHANAVQSLNTLPYRSAPWCGLCSPWQRRRSRRRGGWCTCSQLSSLKPRSGCGTRRVLVVSELQA